jgi:hypothetical protein
VTIRHPVRRRAARDLARALALFSAVLLALSTWSLLSSGSSPVGAAPVAGTLSVDPGEGGSGTEFRLELPGAAACTGDSASGGYQVQTYMIPSSSSPSTLVFGTAGPVEVTGEARRPLMDSNNGDAVVNLQTGITPGGGPGIISGLPFFSFGQLLPGEVPAGTYNIGVACWRPSAEEGEKLDKYWNTKMVVTTPRPIRRRRRSRVARRRRRPMAPPPRRGSPPPRQPTGRAPRRGQRSCRASR